MVRVGQPARQQISTRRALEASIHIGLTVLLVTACLLILRPFIPLIAWGIIIAVALYPGFEGCSIWWEDTECRLPCFAPSFYWLS